MMRDILPRLGRRVAPQQWPQQRLPQGPRGERVAPAAAILPAMTAQRQLEQLQYIALLDRQPAIHIGLAERQLGVARDVERDSVVVNPDRNLPFAAAGTEGLAA